MEQDKVASGMAKLALKQKPIRIEKYKYLMDDLAYKKKGSWLSKSIAFLLRRKQTEEQVNATITAMRNEVIEGVLVPLEEGEFWEVKTRHNEIILQLSRNLPTTELGKQGAENRKRAIDLTGDSIWQLAHIHCALKKGYPDAYSPYERAYTTKQLSLVDPRVLSDIYREYQIAFELDEAELGK